MLKMTKYLIHHKHKNAFNVCRNNMQQKNKKPNTLNFIDVIHECIMFKYINIKDIHMIIEMKTKVEQKQQHNICIEMQSE